MTFTRIGNGLQLLKSQQIQIFSTYTYTPNMDRLLGVVDLRPKTLQKQNNEKQKTMCFR